MINLKNIPSKPGIYLYRNTAGEIIYVGKAINLKKRVTQYFQRDDALGPKTKTLVSQIASIETKTVGSEIEALILESSYIKKYRPKYNSLLKDDRSYIFICISREPIPRIFTARNSSLPAHSDTYGPFPSGSAVNSLLRTIRRLFPYRSRINHPPKPCLYCHLGMCPGPNPDPVIYRQNIGKIKRLLAGKFKILEVELKKEMKLASSENNFEIALERRNQLEAIKYIVTGWRNLSNLFEQINLPDDNQSSAIVELVTTLQPYLNIKKINRIECFDISQMGTKHFVGSMTVWLNGQLDHSQYRKFKISNVIASGLSTKQSPPESMKADDQFMLKEVVFRRLKHPEWGTPDLIVVDGGKPQVSSVGALLAKAPIIGLAKKFETIVIKSQSEYIEINLPLNSHALNLLCALRDEAHRFANRYRKQLMSKTLASS